MPSPTSSADLKQVHHETVHLKGPTTTIFEMLRGAAALGWKDANTSKRSQPMWLAMHHPELSKDILNFTRAAQSHQPQFMIDRLWVPIENYLRAHLDEGKVL